MSHANENRILSGNGLNDDLGGTIDADVRRDQVSLLVNFYNSARQEIIERVAHRDRGTTLFLAATAAVSTVAFARSGSSATVVQTWILLVVPILGLGAAIFYDWHNRIIGKLGSYLSIEFQSEVRYVFTGSRGLAAGMREGLEATREDVALAHWDASQQIVARKTWPRTAAPMALIVLPSSLALLIGVLSLGQAWQQNLALIIGGAVIVVTLAVLRSSAKARKAQMMSDSRRIAHNVDEAVVVDSPSAGIS